MKINIFSKLGLTGRFIGWFLLVALVPMLTIGYLSFLSSQNAMEDQYFNSLTAIAEGRESTLIQYLRAKEGRVADFASDHALHEDIEGIEEGGEIETLSKQLSEYLEIKRSMDPTIYETFILNTEGMIIASTNQDVIGQDKSSDDYFIGGRTGVYIKDAYHSESTDKNSMAFSAPIKGSTGETLAVIVNRYETTGINEITTNREGLGETGEVYIVNKDGYMITDSRFAENTFLTQKADSEPVKLFQNEKETMTGIYDDYRGTDIVGASMGDDLDEEFGLGWVILAEIDGLEAFAAVTTLRNTMLLIGATLLILILLLALYASRSIGEFVRAPIRRAVDKLTAASGQLASSSQQTSASSQQNASIAQQLATGAVQQSKQAEEVSKSVDQLSTAMQQVSSSTQDTSTSATITYATKIYLSS